ncbi:hypothetical protein ONZ43_g1454 [Nemania bipapillata]|uniref:Uncharacterized protein n=1 Tax=Nemania bipapillata TaxID=110536 RepID=A0ACC2J4H3_9PEZI|nr:hypothetical protein ONZ43_g1454 [Nemania bipapillata]
MEAFHTLPIDNLHQNPQSNILNSQSLDSGTQPSVETHTQTKNHDIPTLNMRNKNLILGLPPELRLMVYGFAVVQYVTGPRNNPKSGFTRNLVPPNLAQVNKQLRDEVCDVYYRKNEFWIEVPVTRNHIYKSFFAQCQIAEEYLPLIKSLRCSARLHATSDWFILFQSAEREPATEIVAPGRMGTKGSGLNISMVELNWGWGGGLIACHKNFWHLINDMLKAMPAEDLVSYMQFNISPARVKETNDLLLADALGFIVKQTVLGQGRMKAVFCRERTPVMD